MEATHGAMHVWHESSDQDSVVLSDWARHPVKAEVRELATRWRVVTMSKNIGEIEALGLGKSSGRQLITTAIEFERKRNRSLQPFVQDRAAQGCRAAADRIEVFGREIVVQEQLRNHLAAADSSQAADHATERQEGANLLRQALHERVQSINRQQAVYGSKVPVVI